MEKLLPKERGGPGGGVEGFSEGWVGSSVCFSLWRGTEWGDDSGGIVLGMGVFVDVSIRSGGWGRKFGGPWLY